MQRSVHESLFTYRKYRYALIAAALLFGCLLLYAFFQVSSATIFSLFTSYILGGLCLSIVFFLLMLGVRKRSYQSSAGTVQGWASAHIYFGLLLLCLSLLHSGGEINFSIHGLTYLLMLIVGVSGVVGTLVYLRYPNELSHTLVGSDVDNIYQELQSLDRTTRQVCASCDSNVRLATISALERTSFPESYWQALIGWDRSHVQLQKVNTESGKADNAIVSNKGQEAILRYLSERIPYCHRTGEVERLSELLLNFTRRGELLARYYRAMRIKGILKLWLWFHIPVSIVFVVAMLIHVFVVFYYW